MKCEEFEAMGLDAGRDALLSENERIAAAKHINSCPRCAALEDSWQAARRELRALAADTVAAQAPARVEIRLRQELSTRHHTLKVQHNAVVGVWALAAAAVVVGVVGWITWHSPHGVTGGKRSVSPATARTSTPNSSVSIAAFNPSDSSLALVADNESGDFTLLPGALASNTEDSSILRVRIQRGALSAFGLPVNEDLANEWIQVDLLVGDDGAPQAVRLLQE